MSSTFFWLASLAGIASLAIHVVGGARVYSKAILAATELPPPAKALSLVTWHCASIMFLSYALAMAIAALRPDAVELAFLAIFMCTATVLVFAVFALRGHTALVRLPGAYLCASIALLGVAGILTA